MAQPTRAKINITWKPGRSRGCDAQAVGEALLDLPSRTPDAIVEAAQPAGSPLHPCFTWDDATAAHLHRLSEARNLVRSLDFEVAPAPGVPAEPVSLFAHVRPSDGNGQGVYLTMDEIRAAGPDVFERAVASLMRQIQSLESSLVQIRRFAGPDDSPTAIMRRALADQIAGSVAEVQKAATELVAPAGAA